MVEPDESPRVDRDAVELSRRAYARMEASFSPCPSNLVPSFRVWHYPRAGPQVSWVLFHSPVDDPLGRPPLGRQLVWNRDQDIERLKLGPRRRARVVPEVISRETAIDPVEFADHLAKAREIPFPKRLLTRPFLCDERAEYGIEGLDVEGFSSTPMVRLEWGRQAPESVEPVAEWAARVREWLRGEFE